MDRLELATDIRLATNFAVPVLITASPGRALALAEAIVSGGRKKARVAVYDGAALVDAARQNWRELALARDAGEVVVVAQEVETLSEAEQSALLQLLCAQDQAGYRRIVATSSGGLMDRVREGTFNTTLFYRLNVVHIQAES